MTGVDKESSGARGRMPWRDVWMRAAQRGGRGTAPLRVGTPAVVLPRFTGFPGRRGIGAVGRAAVVGGAFLGVGSSPAAASPAVSGG
ncbi:hypothetical protein ACLQ2Q_03620 [Microbacterium sp. DT81.1]|uniref:hypothetical protein n=1 Tax=Microbacterium sp. DT81.1 TaxID=3393413 RepID=UPI003CEE67BA